MNNATDPSPGELAPKAIGVKSLATDKLCPNPHNPRMLFDRLPLKILKESIAQVGILVPLTVYLESQTGRYVILDGQRRWIVAQELELAEVPVNQVAEPTLVQNIVTMFQIHKLREDWELMPTALKLEVLMDELQERSEKKLAILTRLDQAVVSRCKKLLNYPRRYQDRMLDPDPRRRVKADFFIELYAVRNDRFVNSMDWYSRDLLTDRMLERYQNKQGIKSVTDFRTIKQHLNNARRAKKKREISKRFREFIEDSALGIDHLVIRAADVSAEARRIETNVTSLTSMLRDFDPREYYGEESLWKILEVLYKLIRRKLVEANRRLS